MSKILASVVAVALCATAMAQERPDPVAWLTEHAVPLRSIQPDDEDFSDLAPLKAAIGESRVVMLGEQSHGDGACFAAKSRLIRFLHKEMGFDVLMWESGMDEMRRADRALVGGAPVEECHRLGLFGIWSVSQQVRPLLDYVKASKGSERPLELAGFDCQVTCDAATSPWPREIVEFFDKADAALLSAEQRSAPKEVYAWIAALGNTEGSKEPPAAAAVLREMAGLIDRSHAKLAAAHTDLEIGFMRRTLINVAEYAVQRSEPIKGPKDVNGRDKAMGENLAWLASEYYKGRKVMVWAASFHNARNIESVDGSAIGIDYAGVRPMGQVAYETLGIQIYSIMFVAYGGRIGKPWSGPSPIRDAPEGSLDELMHRTGKPYLFVDFRGLPSGHWLREPIVARPLGYAPMKAVWPGVFDGVVFTDRMFPSTRVGTEPADARPGAK